MDVKGFELQFHWIFIMIAGALILAFFFSIAHKQQTISREKLQLTLATDIENILTSALVSKGTAQRIPSPPDGLSFSCTDLCECTFSVGADCDADYCSRDLGDVPLFAPPTIEQDIIVWSLDLNLPYRATNLLYLTSPTIKYYLVHDNSPASTQLLTQLAKNIPPLITYDNLTLTELTGLEEEGYERSTFVFLNVNPPTLDDSFRREEANAIKIDQQGIGFYAKDGTTLSLTNYLTYAGTPSLYAAMFSANPTMYQCGLKKAFVKLGTLAELYAQRALALEQKAIAAEKIWCSYGTPEQPTSVIGLLSQQQDLAKKLSQQLDKAALLQLNPLVQQLEAKNRQLVEQSCPEVF